MARLQPSNPAASTTESLSSDDVLAGAGINEPLLIARAFAYGFHHAVEVEAAGLLSRGKLVEALQPLADIGAGGREHEHMIHPPCVVADAFELCPLERIHAQIGQHRRTQYLEWRLPDFNSFGVLF